MTIDFNEVIRVTYKDLETGLLADQQVLNLFELTENNYSCDCNRQLAFGHDEGEGHCIGTHRYVVLDFSYAVPRQLSLEWKLDRIAEANQGYPNDTQTTP